MIQNQHQYQVTQNKLLDLERGLVELEKIKERINRCSEFSVKVHKDNIDQVVSMDKPLLSGIQEFIDYYNCDYATLNLKFDYRSRQSTKQMNNSIFKLIRKLIKNKEKVELFNHLSIRAEDKDNNYRLETFDLLVDKVKSEIKVERKKRHRTIISKDIFLKMESEMILKRI